MVSVFLAAMSLAVLADNLGVIWVAVEATTIATAFLVGHRGTRAALEAAWKYVVLGSVGVAIAFLGVVLLYAAARAAGEPTLSWTDAGQRRGSGLDPGWSRSARPWPFSGSRRRPVWHRCTAGSPTRTARRPAPVSGLMSGVLLSVAFYAILRIQAIADAVLGAGLMRGPAADRAGLLPWPSRPLLILRQRDYKRMLAYSSIEHMGLLAVGAAVGGPLALAAVLLHMLGHGLAKATLFVVAGRILAVEGTSRIDDVRGLLARRPGSPCRSSPAMAALLGFPPFACSSPRSAIVVAGWQAGLGWAWGRRSLLLLVRSPGSPGTPWR